MDKCNWTPNKNQMNCDSILMLSPITKTPIRQNNMKLKSSFHSSTSGFSVLPNHITPPSGLTKFIARNPFDADLTSKLHISVMSPTVFSKTSSISQKNSPGFTWSIDELALIHPAKIDEFPEQQMHCSDPEIEKHAQEAISRFFSENQIIPSPCDVKRNECERISQMQTPIKCQDEMNSSKESYRSKKERKDNWTQTVLTLPPELPPHVEEILQPYFNFTQDQNCESEEANTSNTSLRRKLFVNHDDSQDESNNSLSTPSSRSKSPLVNDLSPAQSGMFFHGTPLRTSQINQRTFGSPLASNRNSSPCDVSPIGNSAFNMSCQSIKSRSKSVAKLDFTNDMSIDIEEDNRNSDKKNMCKTLFTEDMKMFSEVNNDQHHSNEDNFCDVTQIYVSSENSTRYTYENKENIAPNQQVDFNIINKSKRLGVHKKNFSESYAMQQSKMISGNYIEHMTCSSNHDTGYQTHSSSNLTSTVDSYSTSIKQKLHWDERPVHTEDEVRLTDWKNRKSMISSTPSKYNREIIHF